MAFILLVHSYLRWAIVVVAVIAIIKFAIGWQSKSTYQSMDRGLMSGYTGLMDLQLLLGIIMLFGFGLVRYRLEHAVTMFLAVGVAHLSSRWRQADDTIKYRNNLIAIVVSILLIFAGIAVLPQGWFG